MPAFIDQTVPEPSSALSDRPSFEVGEHVAERLPTIVASCDPGSKW